MTLTIAWDDEVGDLLPLTAVEDLFLLYCNEESSDARITLTLTDTMYRKRLQSAPPDGLSQLSKKAWQLFINALLPGAMSSTVSSSLIFLKCLGFNNEKKFTLNFPQFIDACYYLAESIYSPQPSSTLVMRSLVMDFLRPLYERIFKEAPSIPKDDMSVVSHASSVRSRVSQLILTPSGVVPITAVEKPAAVVPIAVESLVDQKSGKNLPLHATLSGSSIQLSHDELRSSNEDELKSTISALIAIIHSLRAENAQLRSSLAGE
jgi:hypothetical protein